MFAEEILLTTWLAAGVVVVLCSWAMCDLGCFTVSVLCKGLCLIIWLAAGALPPAEEWNNDRDQPFWQRWGMLAYHGFTV